MPCYYPLKGYHKDPSHPENDGKRGFTRDRKKGYADRLLTLPCGNCIGCRLDRARDWALRCYHEAQMTPLSSYLTLTYAPEHLPAPPTVQPRQITLFMKRLRKTLGIPGLRYYACGEYGDELQRPHYHLLLFGYDFPDKRFWKKNKRGDVLYNSKTLDKIWGFGHCQIGTVTMASAGYVARYIMKKQTGEAQERHYTWTSPDGHTYDLHPEFNQMSRGSKKLRTGGIGQSWYEKFGETDCHNQDFVVGQDKREHPVPAYYDKLLGRKNPERLAEIKRKRSARADLPNQQNNNTSRRLHDREIVQKSKIKLLTREYEK